VTKRRYTIDEIDNMRSALNAMSLHGLCPGGHGMWSGDYERERVNRIEARLRTYLEDGIDPEEMRDKALAYCGIKSGQ
jgi:hypothetical protein